MAERTRSSLGVATAQTFAGNTAVVVLQAFHFIALARLLGADEYGRIAAVNAMLPVAGPLADLGFGNLLVMRCSVDRNSAQREVSTALLATWTAGTALVGIVLTCAILLYGPRVGIALPLLFGIAELICFRTVWVCAQFYVAIDRFGVSSTLITVVSACRILALLGPLCLTTHRALAWVEILTGLSLLCAALTVIRVRAQLGGFSFSFAHLRANVREAIHFSLGTAARGTYTDLDKVLLGRYDLSVQLGAYTSAYRLVAMTFMPVRSLLQASVGRFFRAGTTGLTGTMAVTRRVLRYSVPYSLVGAAGLYFFAPLVPIILGHSFTGAVPMVRCLAILPVVQSIQYAYSDALTGAGYQSLRTRMQFCVVGAYGALGIFLVPRYQWKGAAATCLVSETLLAIFMITLAHHLHRRPVPLQTSSPERTPPTQGASR